MAMFQNPVGNGTPMTVAWAILIIAVVVLEALFGLGFFNSAEPRAKDRRGILPGLQAQRPLNNNINQ